MSYPEIQALRDKLNRRAIRRQIAIDMLRFVILPLAIGFTIEGLFL